MSGEVYAKPVKIPEGYVLQGHDSRGGEVWGPSKEYEAELAAKRLRETERLARQRIGRRLAGRAEALDLLEGNAA
jgi:hypothetical protein